MKKPAFISITLLILLALTFPALAAEVDRLDPIPQNSSAPAENVPGITPIQPIQSPAAAPVEPIDPSTANSDVSAAESSCQEETPSSPNIVVRQPGRGTISDIFQYWEENGYPDYVSYAYEAGGEMNGEVVNSWWEIGLADNSEEHQQEILELVSPFCLVEFRSALFTHAEKQAAYERLTELAQTDENILEIIFLRNSDSIWVAVPEDLEKEYAQYLIRDCGLGAVVSVTDENSIATIDGTSVVSIGTTPGMGLDVGGEIGLLPEPGPLSRIPPAVWACLALAAATVTALIVLSLRRFRAPAAVTAEGGQKNVPAAPLTGRQVEEKVKKAVEVPDSTLYQALLEELKKTDNRH